MMKLTHTYDGVWLGTSKGHLSLGPLDSYREIDNRQNDGDVFEGTSLSAFVAVAGA